MIREVQIELRKGKRAGVLPIMILLGLFGALYIIAFFLFRKDSLLNMPLAPMDVLISPAYGMVMVLNMFGVIVGASIIYNMEFKGSAIKKMYMLPIHIPAIYLSKLLILSVSFFAAIVVQTSAFTMLGNKYLNVGDFDFVAMVYFAVYAYLTSLAVTSFMLFIASRFENLWIPLGIGVGGFLTGMAFATVNLDVMLFHPFVVMIKVAMAMSTKPSVGIIIASILHILLWNGIGIWFSKYKSYE